MTIDYRARLTALDYERQCLDAKLAGAIEGAHENGMSWSEIAEVLGLTRQSIHQRYQRSQKSRCDSCGHSEAAHAYICHACSGAPCRQFRQQLILI